MKIKLKSEKGVTGIDLASGLIIFVISSVIVINLYYQIYINSISTKIHEVIVGCVTEIFEKVDLEDYDKVTDDNLKKWITESKLDEYFNYEKNGSFVDHSITKYTDKVTDAKDLVKQINITVEYEVGGNRVKFPMNKLKIKELN